MADSIEEFCARHGVTAPFEMERVHAGRNGEVWRLFSADGQWIVKNYYPRRGGEWDRLGTEFDFLAYLNLAGVRAVARPLGLDRSSHRALYTFLPGTRPGVITSSHIAQAAAFVVEINERRSASEAVALPPASEACFGLRDQLELTEHRLDRLRAIRPGPGVQGEALAFVNEQVQPRWDQIKNGLRERGEANDQTDPVSLDARILSPSDFGFHNTLESTDGLRFVDFEYAGWDDPAKLICDFTCQPELPVSERQAGDFTTALLDHLPHPEATARRVEAFLPIHRLRWVCILLNEFRDDAWLRRRHAGVETDGLLAAQLDKATRYFQLHLTHSN